jgi:hypothetical protein
MFLQNTKEKKENKVDDLNSILVEGTIVVAPYKVSKKEPACYFMIENKKRYGFSRNNKEKLFENSSLIPIEAREKLGESIFNRARLDKKVRIVGQLKEGTFYKENKREYHTLYILAEHAEIRPDV